MFGTSTKVESSGAVQAKVRKVVFRRRKIMLTVLVSFASLVIILGIVGAVFLHLPKFGALSSGARLERIKASPNYRDGAFQNLIYTPRGMEDGSSFFSSLLEFLRPKKRITPSAPIPSVKVPDLGGLPDGSLLWFGHSAFLIKLGGKTFLFDPTLSENASPFSWMTKAFEGTKDYKPEDLPKIDYLLISHDHWDHLDYPTVMAIKERTSNVVCPLGVGAHFEKWGFGQENLIEGDWWDVIEPEPSLKITFIPSRHFSGRGLRWNKSLWTGLLLEFGGKKIFYSGDGGYLPQYVEFGEKVGPVDLAIIECGQYDRRWKSIHMSPEESTKAALNMRAKATMPVHSGKFSIANHTWDDPFIRFKAAVGKTPMRLISPRIGQVVDLNDPNQEFQDWWTEID
jgi:L-ascorbate metabolism protein UlaG (beta-lactamase superfamily)